MDLLSLRAAFGVFFWLELLDFDLFSFPLSCVPCCPSLVRHCLPLILLAFCQSHRTAIGSLRHRHRCQAHARLGKNYSGNGGTKFRKKIRLLPEIRTVGLKMSPSGLKISSTVLSGCTRGSPICAQDMLCKCFSFSAE